jgi:hypothetical protein
MVSRGSTDDELLRWSHVTSTSSMEVVLGFMCGIGMKLLHMRLI